MNMNEKALVKNGENAVIDADYESYGDTPSISQGQAVDLIVRLEKLIERRDLNEIANDDMALERFLKLQENIFRILVMRTRPRDWIDRGGYPELQGTGFWPIRAALQIGMYWTKKPEIEIKGGHRYATCEGIFFHPQLGVIQEMGSRSTEDKFVADWTDADLKKCAIANMFSRGMTRLVGISRLTWKELQAINPDLTPGEASQIDHNTGGRGGSRKTEWDEETTNKAKWIHKWINEITGGKPDDYKMYLVKTSEYEYQGKKVSGVERVEELTPGRVKVVYDKVLREYEKFSGKKGDEVFETGGKNGRTSDTAGNAGADPGSDPDNYYGDNDGGLFPPK